ncbi:D-alanyl-D-alanine carboxypeptidase [Desulfobotulus sp.]|jgi:D-alanyl-D-alanine carboxypeptidase/D-alanyl-D-alanine-endopeptidase (penicillin-binding protein 4)|uniref:D-alanyl-D-alanine carboxypeptidase n=1 Tax=Desulfobotulus sp. TaxID=1940337 RepID=UPI002A36EA1D|nr:D-alanyl-D-alanine carboxypeptidase [Desulfobotulus sp.]MDY0162036.1 D-alanyl-D-alanine carboxypeptidase [Desulfobotulus sp.]
MRIPITHIIRIPHMPHILVMLFFLLASPLFHAWAAEQTTARNAWLLKTPDGEVLASQNPAEGMPPASILKILTSLYALETLGPEYRIVTPWHTDSEGNLVLTSRSDPLLTSMPLKTMIARLAEQTPHRHFTGLVVDVSRFEKKIPIDGRSARSLRSYNAPLTAFAVNFNSVSFKTEKGRLVSGEEETPLLPMVIGPIQASRMASGRIALPEESDFPIRYAAALTRHFLEEAGFTFENSETRFRENPPTEPDTLLLEVPSNFSIADIVHQLMAHSNNVIANQLLLFTASQNVKDPKPIGLEDARKDLSLFVEKRLGIQNFFIEEGSGLSRKNQISCQEMIKALDVFIPYMDLMRREVQGRYKTGTLSDVRTRAGFLKGAEGWYPYVLMTQGENEAYLRHLETLKQKVRSRKNLTRAADSMETASP